MTGTLLVVGAIVVCGTILVIGARRAGRDEERLDATEEVLDDANEITAARRDDDLRERVRRGTFGD